MFTFILVVQAIVAASLVTVILMQRSEGGGLGMGGSPSGLMSARGTADFLTRATTILAIMFVSLSIVLAAIAATSRGSGPLDTSLARTPATAPAAAPIAPTGDAGQFTGAARTAVEPGNAAAPADNSAVPLQR
ncbi:MAG: preprotein translocase subunit SecG [Pseudomonadota bacterium]